MCVGRVEFGVFRWWWLKRCCSGVLIVKCMIIDRCNGIGFENFVVLGSLVLMVLIIWCNVLFYGFNGIGI